MILWGRSLGNASPPIARTVSFTALLLTLASGLGCGLVEETDCSLLTTCGRCDPTQSDGPIGDDCGYFVSASIGSDDLAGTKAAPVRTLARAIELAGERSNAVFACAEEFTEALVIPSGIKLYGGLDCGRSFQPSREGRRTSIAAPPDVVAVTVLGSAWTTRLSNVSIRAADAIVEGGSSIAVLVLEGATFELLFSDVEAGSGAEGLVGDTLGPTAAGDGIAGTDGEPACGFGGGAVDPEPTVLTCGEMTSVGGQGGIPENTGDAQSGGTGLPLFEVSAAGAGGEGATTGAPCSEGAAGQDGRHGETGKGGAGLGRLSAFGFVGVRGRDGGRGLPGQGGGGGGGSRSSGGCMGISDNLGAWGGAGGTGGCGGKGGRGGGFGGASIGVASVFASVRLDAVDIFTGRGGDGGAGGSPELGGLGGPGGKGGEGSMNVSGGCAGGKGGRGGHGGSGGGGSGGPSIGVAFVGRSPMVDRVTAAPLQGGYGGLAPMLEGRGEDGSAALIMELEGSLL
jgi:hypothetical protein